MLLFLCTLILHVLFAGGQNDTVGVPSPNAQGGVNPGNGSLIDPNDLGVYVNQTQVDDSKTAGPADEKTQGSGSSAEPPTSKDSPKSKSAEPGGSGNVSAPGLNGTDPKAAQNAGNSEMTKLLGVDPDTDTPINATGAGKDGGKGGPGHNDTDSLQKDPGGKPTGDDGCYNFGLNSDCAECWLDICWYFWIVILILIIVLLIMISSAVVYFCRSRRRENVNIDSTRPEELLYVNNPAAGGPAGGTGSAESSVPLIPAAPAMNEHYGHHRRPISLDAKGSTEESIPLAPLAMDETPSVEPGTTTEQSDAKADESTRTMSIAKESVRATSLKGKPKDKSRKGSKMSKPESTRSSSTSSSTESSSTIVV